MSLVGHQDRVVNEKRKALAFHRVRAVIKAQGQQILPVWQYLLEQKTCQTLIRPRLDLGENFGHDKNSVNVLQAASGIITRVHC